jgi:hypothetical protein
LAAAGFATGFAELAGGEFLLRRKRAVADGGAFFVVGEEGGFFQARPEGVLFDAEDEDVVDVGFG